MLLKIYINTDIHGFFILSLHSLLFLQTLVVQSGVSWQCLLTNFTIVLEEYFIFEISKMCE